MFKLKYPAGYVNLLAIFNRLNWEIYMDYVEAKSLFESNLSITDEIIKKYCYRHNVGGDEADECNSYVYEKIIDNDYQQIREFKGKSSYETYMSTVIFRILIDRMRSSGRWRPSQKALKIGKEAVILEELVFRKKYSFEQAYNILTTNHNISIERERAYEIITLLQRKRLTSALPRDVELTDDVSDKKVTLPDEAAINKETSKIKGQLDYIVTDLRNLLSNEERLLLRMRFEDNIKISEIARVLKKDRDYIDKKLKAILTKFKDEILSRNISIDDINAFNV